MYSGTSQDNINYLYGSMQYNYKRWIYYRDPLYSGVAATYRDPVMHGVYKVMQTLMPPVLTVDAHYPSSMLREVMHFYSAFH